MGSSFVDPLIKVLIGTEAGRRVGWAKYYEAERNLEIVEGSTSAREGFIAGMVHQAQEMNVPLDVVAHLIWEYLDGRVDTPGSRKRFEDAAREGASVMTHFWLNTDAKAVDTGPDFLVTARVQGSQCRCARCNRMIGVIDNQGYLSHKCYRCKTINIFRNPDVHDEPG